MDGWVWDKWGCADHRSSCADKAMLRYKKLRAFFRPLPWETRNIRHVLSIGKHAQFLLKDTDVEAWGEMHEEDLVALRDGQLDRFMVWVRGSFLVWWHRCVGFRFMVSCGAYSAFVRESEAGRELTDGDCDRKKIRVRGWPGILMVPCSLS